MGTSGIEVWVIYSGEQVRAHTRSVLLGEGFVVRTFDSLAQLREALQSDKPLLAILGLYLIDGSSLALFAEGLLEGITVIGLGAVFSGRTVRELLLERYPFLAVLEPGQAQADLIEVIRIHLDADYPSLIASRIDDADFDSFGLSNIEKSQSLTLNEEEISGPLQTDPTKGGFKRVSTAPFAPLQSTQMPAAMDWSKVPDRGDLAHSGVAPLYTKILRKRLNGALYLWRERVRKIVFFANGCPVSVRSNLVYECLGSLLTRENILTEEQAQLTLDRAQAEGRRQGEVAIEMGLLDESLLRHMLRLQLRERILDTFGWSQAQFQIVEGEQGSQVSPLSRQETMELVLEGVLEYAPLEPILEAVEKSLPNQLKLNLPAAELVDYGLEDRHRAILEEMEEGSSLLELVAQFDQGAQVHQVVYGLSVLGLLNYS